MSDQEDKQQQEEQYYGWVRSSHFGRKGVIIAFFIVLITGLALAIVGQKGEANLQLPHQGSPLEPNNKAPSQVKDSIEQAANQN